MALNAPPSQDVQDIQFKLHDRFSAFFEGKNIKSLVSLLAVSSTKGLLFAGNPNSNELKVFKVREIVDSKATNQNVNVRVVNLPGEPKVLACSCDGSMLAVNYVANNTGFLSIYQVDSFVTPTTNLLYNLPVVPESNIFALQLLWNPVVPNNIALILTDGSVVMYNLNNGGQYDKVTLGKEHQVKSGCWSPKGKQIVFGFAEGKLQQFKPNLQPARAISCPPGIYPGPFDCIAVHWLSTFQFAAIFLQRGQDMCPSLFIINAPKAGQPSYINYYDVCYSAPGPRIHQLSFYHIAQWNLLLVISANGVEVGVMGTKESGEIPNWVQYTLLDEARIEMPLTESKDETYPLGFAFDTSSTHQLVLGEKKLHAMPMIHVLSTHGHLVSYNFLNLSTNATDICSPPPPLNDTSGQFVSLRETLVEGVPVQDVQVVPAKNSANTNEHAVGNKQYLGQVISDMTFTLGSNVATSTPAIKDKPMPLFSSQPIGSNSGTGIVSSTSAAPSFAPVSSNTAQASQQFGRMATGTPFGAFSGTGFTTKSSETTNQTSANKNTDDVNKPLYTVPPTFTPPNATQQQTNKTEVKPVKPAVNTNKLNTGEIDEVVKQMVLIQIQSFETEIRQIRQQSSRLLENIGSPNEIKSYTKELNDLQEIVEQAKDHEFEQDVQSLRHSMNESYAMLAECRTKLDLYNNPNSMHLSAVSFSDPTSRRQLAKLQAYVASNQSQLYQLSQLIEAQWSQYQDVIRRNSKNQMHIPCLDGIYQRMSKLKDLLARQRTKMNYIKTKLKQKGINYKTSSDIDVTSAAVGALTKNQSTMESLADSILSMSLLHVVSQTHAKLPEEKLNAIRNFTKRQQQIATIKPKRPDRVGLKSEVILETKLETERRQKEIAKKQVQNQQKQQLYPQQSQQQQQFAAYKVPANIQAQLSSKPQQQQNYQPQMPQQLLKSQSTLSATQQPPLAKPTASKPVIVSSQPPNFITPTSSAAATLFIGCNSSFVKTSSVPKSEETLKPVATTTPFTGFGITNSQPSLNFSQSKPIQNTANEGKENKVASTPISFSAKVIGGNDAKPFANAGNKTAAPTNSIQSSSQGFTGHPSTGFSSLVTTKPTTQPPSNQDKDKTKKPEEASKQFVSATTSTETTTTSAPASFGGFVATNKSTITTAPFSSSAFGSQTIPSTVTPFSALSSSFSFNTTVTTSSTANNSNKTETTTTNLSQPTAVATNKPIETKSSIISTASTTTITTTSATITTGSVSSNISASDTKTSDGIPENKTTVTNATSNNNPIATEDPSDSLFDSLTICKPTAKEAGESNKGGNIFSGFAVGTSSASTGPFSFVAPTSSIGEGTQSGFSFISAATATPKASTATECITASTSSSSAGSNTVSTSVTSATPTTTSETPSFSFVATAATTTAATVGSIFDSLSVSTSTVAGATTTVTSTVTGNIFSGGSTIFGGGAAVASPAPSLFASSAPASTSAVTPGSGSIFSTAAAATPQTGGNLFGGIPKPEQSVFSATNTQPVGTGLFAAAAANSKPAAVAGGSIFGGGSPTGFGGSAAGSIFGGGGAVQPGLFASTAPSNAPGSVFGAATSASKPAEGGGIFGSPTQQSPTSGGSIFSKSSFGATAAPQSAGSIFGGGNALSPTSSGFGGSGGSIFGGSNSANTATSGSSLFSATPAFGASTTSPGFGSFAQPSTAPAFSSPTSGGFGAPASTGFASPQQQSAFAKPVFGGPATFGSPQPAFGAQPTFGGAPAFGSPKGFGSFAATSPNASTFGSQTQGTAAPKSNIFETLGSQDSGLSFGNLAHSTQAPQQKPAFGGSSFMNYRS